MQRGAGWVMVWACMALLYPVRVGAAPDDVSQAREVPPPPGDRGELLHEVPVGAPAKALMKAPIKVPAPPPELGKKRSTSKTAASKATLTQTGRAKLPLKKATANQAPATKALMKKARSTKTTPTKGTAKKAIARKKPTTQTPVKKALPTKTVTSKAATGKTVLRKDRRTQKTPSPQAKPRAAVPTGANKIRPKSKSPTKKIVRRPSR